MIGIVDYGSSDEEDASETNTTQASNTAAIAKTTISDKPEPVPAPSTEPIKDVEMRDAEPEPLENVQTGPSLGPAMPQSEPNSQDHEQLTPLSPYSATQTLVRSLTMPPVPNFSIPESPPSSPPQQANKKFAHFLELKKEGVHFNTKLEDSPALRNPALLQKLMGFAGVDDYDQYASALPDDLAVPTSYPPWAYGEQLNKTQQQLLKKKDDIKAKIPRERLDFVASAEAGATSKAPGQRTTGNRSTAEKVMSGVDRDAYKSKKSQRYDEGDSKRRR
ncbi:hypothetical protein BT63DRAFT_427717 [Microthyrium microscopicum]|uniref:HCNGP-domain-containing protein n=1 Tax=Microthyrium microscopicum TaxID=703497 RepID=A0A6A6U0V0_9PEZI|nr:hypothetical protein BT63DRAFT_427717 [Microthyrium microscopicum]